MKLYSSLTKVIVPLQGADITKTRLHYQQGPNRKSKVKVICDAVFILNTIVFISLCEFNIMTF